MKIGAVILMAFAFAACSKSSSSNPTGPSSSDTTVSFVSEVQPIFTTNCALAGCHVSSGTIAPMSLEAGKSYANLVNVLSTEDASFYRVKPFNSDSSYLYLKITGAAGTRMPLNKQALGQAQISTIKGWIDQGAKNN